MSVNKWLILVRLLLGDIPERVDLTAPGMQVPLVPYFDLTQAVRSGDLIKFKYVGLLLFIVGSVVGWDATHGGIVVVLFIYLCFFLCYTC